MVLMLLTGVGLAQLFDRVPLAHTVLKVVSVVYLLYLAWKIATATPVDTTTQSGKPMTFLQAAAFQWVNPKAWSMALTAITVYVSNGDWQMLLLAAGFFAVVNLPSVTIWTVAGQQLARTQIPFFVLRMVALRVKATSQNCCSRTCSAQNSFSTAKPE